MLNVSIKEMLLNGRQPDDDYLTEDEKAQLKRKVGLRPVPRLSYPHTGAHTCRGDT
jgi:hypothetical protein